MATDRSLSNIYAGSSVLKYPNPYFDLSKNYMPKSIKELFSYCRTFYYTNDFINNVVRKLTEYPITDIVFEEISNKSLELSYQTYFDQRLHLKDLLISIGLDYFTYGNCFVISHLKTKRSLVAPDGKEYLFEDLTNITFKGGKIHAKLKGSMSAQALVLTIQDVPIKNVNGLIFNRLNPENITIEFDEFTGECEYYYEVPADIKKKIRANNKDALKKTPKVLLDAIENKKRVKLDNKNLFHFKAPTLSENDRGWGKPQILPAMKKLYYMATLMRGNEAIAVEHIVPKKVIFPSASGAFDLHNMSLSNWTSEASANIKKWKTDPNHIAIMPIPMGYQELGGTGRSLLLTPELKFLEETIVNGLGVPIEFIKGGASWTGSSVSLRIIENHFLNYRERLLEFINHFIIQKMHEFLGFQKAKVKFTKMRMNDDSETKQMAINLNAQNKISDETLLSEMSYDPLTERQRIKEELEFRRELAIEDALAQAEAQGRAQLIMAKYQIQAQLEGQDEAARQDEKLFVNELEEELGVDEEGVHLQVKKLAASIMMMQDPKVKQQAMNELYAKSPITFSLVMQRIGQIEAEAQAASQEMEKNRINQEKERIDMTQKMMDIKENTDSKGNVVRTRNEDKSGPKRDAQSGKQRA